MPAYHLAIARIQPVALRATKELMDARPHTLSRRAQLKAMRHWLALVAPVYTVPVPAIGFSNRARNGIYIVKRNAILMPHYSTITLLHEFRHACQYQLPHHRFVVPDPSQDRYEEDARAWSLSVYWRLRPDSLRRLVAAGRVYNLTPEDLGAP